MSVTNSELLYHLSEHAKVGPVMQMVLIAAIDNYSSACLRQDKGCLGEAAAMISEEAWLAACQEIQDTLNNRGSVPVPPALREPEECDD